MTGNSGDTRPREALRLLFLLSVSVFVTEASVIFALAQDYSKAPGLIALVDATLLTILLSPVLYFLVCKPLTRVSEALTDRQKRGRSLETSRRERQEAAARFADIIESTSDWFWEMDADLRFTFMSSRFFELFDIAPEDFIGKTRSEFAGATADNDEWRRHLDDLAHHRPFRDFAYAATMADGSTRHIVISGKPVFDADGTFKGYRGTGTDKTAEIEVRRALEESEKQFRNLIEGSIQGSLVHVDWDILFVNRAMADILGYANPEEILALGRFERLIAPDEVERLHGYKTARQKGEYAPEIYEARGLRKDGAKIWLEFRVTKIEWQGVPALQTVVVDITERKRAEKALREQNERFNAAIQTMSQGLCMYDSEHRLAVWNDRYAALYDTPPEQLRPGMTPREILEDRAKRGVYGTEDGTNFIEEVVGQIGEGGVPCTRTRRLANGRVVEVKQHVMPSGGWLATHEDITERIQAEEALRQSQALFSKAFHASPAPFAISHPEDGAHYDVNEAWMSALGYSRAEAMTHSATELGIWVDPAARTDFVDRLKKHGSVRDFEAKFRTKGGEERDFLVSGEYVELDGEPRLLVVCHDVTELKKAERALKEQNERFHAALENMTQGLCMFDSEQRLVVCNRRYALMYDLPPDLLKPGVPFREIVGHRIAAGVYAGDNPEAYIQERVAAVLEREPSTKIQELTDGRVIVIAHQPLADGGWLATHEDITDYRRIEKRLAYLAHHDVLTDLPNRALLRERLEEKLKHGRLRDAFALLYLDLDGFKGINDTLGHSAGDELLKAVSVRLSGCIRETDTLARLGGDEFAIIQCSARQPVQATALADRICETLATPVHFGHHEVMVGISMGIAFAPKDGTDPDQLLKNADLALYQAKSEHRGAYRIFEPEMESRTNDRHALGLDLRKALARREFELYYQPLLNLERNEVTGFEALLRWHHPQRLIVKPTDFIPIAEETGLIGEIGAWALKQACLEAINWPDRLKVAVNVSSVQFKRGNLLEVVRGALEDSRLSPDRLELEITESVILRDDEKTLDALHALKEMGVRISMDDFGTGYSSLSYLRSFPFDKIKIDASFVQDLSARNNDIGIVHAAVRLASKLGVATTAEGVETEEQLDIVKAEGCTEAQGYLFSPPRPASEILHLLRRYKKKMISAA